MAEKEPRPSREEYNMALAVEVATRSNCMKSHVGAIVIHDGRIRAVGYNGTVEGYPDCYKGGCPRCSDLTITQGQQLDRCICVHAEENALISAARYGIELEGAECYVTHDPCLGCTKLLIQAHIEQVVFLKNYDYPDSSDHNETRKLMRKQCTTTTFISFKDAVADRCEPQKIKEWTDRLDKIKKDALDYAEKIGVLKKK